MKHDTLSPSWTTVWRDWWNSLLDERTPKGLVMNSNCTMRLCGPDKSNRSINKLIHSRYLNHFSKLPSSFYFWLVPAVRKFFSYIKTNLTFLLLASICPSSALYSKAEWQKACLDPVLPLISHLEVFHFNFSSPIMTLYYWGRPLSRTF